jgi:hypothetical protein
MISRPSLSPQSPDTSGGIVDKFALTYERLKACLPVDLVEIDKDLIEMPVIAQEAAELAATMMNCVATAKHELEIAGAEARSVIRVRLLVNGKPPSETRVDSEVPLDEVVQMRRRELDALEYKYRLASDLARSMQKKSDQIGNATSMILKGFMTPNSVYENQVRDRVNARRHV